ncbi:hypothetical protein ILUMI_26093 [Ignelater luminosus]|uniref:Uncharacterized protein n=1 Tax=Ignelater luminosus TaxID=2038154 RepID=A0A8K0FZ07_IGNLU|nr:hypothetical protein ILUMI_26093 [Ignelater luminosus]
MLITTLNIQKPVLRASDIFTVGTRLLASISGTPSDVLRLEDSGTRASAAKIEEYRVVRLWQKQWKHGLGIYSDICFDYDSSTLIPDFPGELETVLETYLLFSLVGTSRRGRSATRVCYVDGSSGFRQHTTITVSDEEFPQRRLVTAYGDVEENTKNPGMPQLSV